KNRKRESDRSGALVILQRLRAAPLLADVVRDALIEARLRLGKLIWHGVCDALGEERCAVELEQVLLHHPAHQVRNVDLMHSVAETALETIAVEQGEEELEVLLLAVVRRRRHQQEVTSHPGEQPA